MLSTTPTTTPPAVLEAAERLELAQQLFREFHTRCFWHSPRDLAITEDLIPFVVRGCAPTAAVVASSWPGSSSLLEQLSLLRSEILANATNSFPEGGGVSEHVCGERGQRSRENRSRPCLLMNYCKCSGRDPFSPSACA
jgi:hypothetical protein